MGSASTIGSHIPSDSGPWQTLRDDESGDAHVIPAFVKAKHRLSRDCWCHPYIEDERYEEKGVIVHNVAQ